MGRSAVNPILSGVLVFLIGFVFAMHAYSVESDVSLESLTNSLLALNERYQRAQPSAKPELLAKLKKVVVSRSRLMRALMKENPSEALRTALPAAARRKLPAEVRNYVENEIEIDGELQILHEDHPQGSRYLYSLRAPQQAFSLHFAADPPDNFFTGALVRVRGIRLNDALVVGSGRDVRKR